MAWGMSMALSFLVFWLYRIPLQAISYVLLLSCSLWFLYFALEFRNYVKGWQRCQRLKEETEYNLMETDMAVSLEESEYLEMIQQVISDYKHQLWEAEQKKQEQNDYVMLWVHQIKTPITAMNLLLQSDVPENISDLQDELFEMEKYVDAMLQYVRLDSLNADFLLEECSLDSVVKTVIRYYSKSFIKKKLYVRLDSLNYTVKTDEKWLVFALKQILSNALKYTKEGGISIIGQQLDSEGNVELVIEDTGCGIVKEDLPRIFEKAFTGYNGHMEQKATGIGLFLTKKILDKLGHAITITSKEGKGTTVSICFQNWKIQSLAD